MSYFTVQREDLKEGTVAVVDESELRVKQLRELVMQSQEVRIAQCGQDRPYLW